MTSTPVFIEKEGMAGVLHFAYDVTDRKTSEAELKKLNLELEKRVEERTEELEYLINELDAFTYSVSHDLKVPLRSIEGFCHLHSQEDYPGTGIGLSIVSRVVHRHCGEVWAEGEPGQGAAFYFKLPLNEDRA